jgi:hypothetical protein
VPLFAVGVLFSLVLTAAAVWGDLEASLFDSSIREETSLRPYSCPVLLTTAETGTIRFSLSNPTDRPIERYIQTNISEGYITYMRRIQMQLPIAPGETEEVEYTVSPEDAAFGRFILARTRVLRNAPLPSASSACGIMVLDLPFLRGNQIETFLLVVGLFGMGGGWGLWLYANRPLKRKSIHITYSMLLLMVIQILGLFFSLSSMWIMGLIMLVVALVVLVEMAAYLGQQD